MADPTKTQDIVIMAHTAITHPNTFIGAEIDVSAVRALEITFYHAAVEATANTNPGIFTIYSTPYASGNKGWAEVFPFQASDGTPEAEALTATEAIGEKVIAVASTTNFLAKSQVYLKDGSVLADSEWAELEQIVANTSLDLLFGLTVGKDSGDTAWSNAEKFTYKVNCDSKKRVICIFSHEGATGANVDIKALATKVGYQ